MTDLLTENARLRAALEDIAEGMGEDTLADVGRYAKHIAAQALATPAPDAVQEAARVPEIAALIEAAKDLYETAIATKARVTGGIGGQTIECSMRSTMHSVSLFHLDVLSAALRAIAGDRT